MKWLPLNLQVSRDFIEVSGSQRASSGRQKLRDDAAERAAVSLGGLRRHLFGDDVPADARMRFHPTRQQSHVL